MQPNEYLGSDYSAESPELGAAGDLKKKQKEAEITIDISIGLTKASRTVLSVSTHLTLTARLCRR